MIVGLLAMIPELIQTANEVRFAPGKLQIS